LLKKLLNLHVSICLARAEPACPKHLAKDKASAATSGMRGSRRVIKIEILLFSNKVVDNLPFSIVIVKSMKLQV
jgi:hypothetical protein